MKSAQTQKRTHVVTSNGLVCVVPRKQPILKIKLLDENTDSTIVSLFYLRLRQWGEWGKNESEKSETIEDFNTN